MSSGMRRQAIMTSLFFFLTFLYNMATQTTQFQQWRYGVGSDAFVVRDIPGRGKGVIAIRRISVCIVYLVVSLEGSVFMG